MAVFVTDAPDVTGSFDRESGVGVSSRLWVTFNIPPLKTRKD